MDLLGVTIDSKLKFDAHVATICRKVSQQVAVLKRMKKILPFDIRIASIRHLLSLVLTIVPKHGIFAVSARQIN